MRRLPAPLRQEPLALAGLCFIVILVLAAIFAPWITSYGYKERTPICVRARRGITGSVPTRSATTCTPESSTAPASLKIGVLSTLIALFIGVRSGRCPGSSGDAPTR